MSGRKPVHDIEALRLAYDDAKGVLNQQVDRLDDMDDKAASILRLDALLLGLLLTAGSIAARSDSVSLSGLLNWWLGVGAALLVLSLLAAATSYIITEAWVGIGPTDIQRILNQKYSEKELLILLLRSSGEWMKENEVMNRRNAIALSITVYSLAFGVLAASIGIVIAIHRQFGIYF